MKLLRQSPDKHLYVSYLRFGPPMQDNKTRWETTYSARNENAGPDDDNEKLDKINLESDSPNFIRDAICDRFGDRNDLRILELGCGVGTFAIALLEDGYDIHLTDFSGELVEYYLKPKLVRHGMQPERAFVVDARNLQSLRSTYDVIMLVGTVNEFQDPRIPREIYEQVFSKLKRGGIFIHIINSHCSAQYLRYQNCFYRFVRNAVHCIVYGPPLALQILKGNTLLRRFFNKPALTGKNGAHAIFSYYLYDPQHLANELKVVGFDLVKMCELDLHRSGAKQAESVHQRYGYVAAHP